MLRFFEHRNYIDIVKEVISDNIHIRGYQSQLAKAAGCHASHLSHVLNGRAHFNLEQAIAICEFWKLNDLHTDYFVTLVNQARAGTDLLREKLNRDLEKIRSDSLRGVSLQHSDTPVIVLESDQCIHYMSAWYISAIHAALGIEHLRTVKALAARFHLPEEQVALVLKELEDYKMAKCVDGIWTSTSLMALGGDTKPIIKIYHNVVRQKANVALDTRIEHDYFTTNLMTFAKSQLPEIKTRLQNMVRSILEESQKSEQEELVFLAVDFFVP